MAITVDAPPSASDRVATAATGIYASHRRAVRRLDLGLLVGNVAGKSSDIRCVIAPDESTVEVVLNSATMPADLVPPIGELAAQGWDVIVLVPSERLGSAHAGLRGAPCMLQSWWIKDDEVVFGRLELP